MTGSGSIRPLIISAASPCADEGSTHSAASCTDGRADGHSAIPELDRQTWRLRVFGRCAEPLEIDWEQLMELPQVDLRCALQCPGGRTSSGEEFTGVPAHVFLDLVRPDDEASHVAMHTAASSGEDWSTVVSLDNLARADSVLAWMGCGHLLTSEQGAPLRAIIPSLERSSSVKWLTGIELCRNADLQRP